MLATGWILIAVCCYAAPKIATWGQPRATFIPSGIAIKTRRVWRNNPGVLPLSAAELGRLCDALRPRSEERLTPSICLHSLRLHGIGSSISASKGAPNLRILDVLLDDELGAKWFGERALVKTRYGARFTCRAEHGASAEAHRDQCLAALAELAVPLTHPLRTSGSRLTVRDLLNDSLAQFHLDQEELAWSALAYSLYLPPSASWCNRFGERFSFDDLVDELLERPMNDASCFGLHVIISLTTICQVDRCGPIITPANRSKLVERLKALAATCAASQDEDGSWTYDWHRSAAPRAAHPYELTPGDMADARLVMTGHVAEWLQLLPEHMQPSRSAQARAAEYLLNCLRAANGTQLRTLFCPYTHAAYAVANWSLAESGHAEQNR